MRQHAPSATPTVAASWYALGVEDDFALLDRWRGGDRVAGNLLFERHFDSLVRFFYGKAGAETEDLVQATMLGCVEAQPNFRRDCSFRTFLFAIARNKLLAHFRGRASDRLVDPLVSSVHALGTSPSEVVARGERGMLLRDALSRVPLDFQIALELRYFEGLTPKEVAEVLDIDRATARTRLHRGRTVLRGELEKLEADPAACQVILQGFVRDRDDDEPEA